MVRYYEHNEREYRNYIRKYPPNQKDIVASLRFLLSKMEDLKIKSVFEVGCGYGSMAKEILRKFKPKTYVGIDLSVDQIAAANMFLKEEIEDKKIKVKLGDIIKYKDRRKYDLVFCSTVISHIPPRYINKAIKNMCALSKKYIIVIEPTKNTVSKITTTGDQWLHNYERFFSKNGWHIADTEIIRVAHNQYMRFEVD